MARGKTWASSTERARMKAAVIATYGTVCHLCNQPITKFNGRSPESFSIDHVVPLNAGGQALDLNNCRSSHLACNIAKSDKPMTEYMDQHVNAMDWVMRLT